MFGGGGGGGFQPFGQPGMGGMGAPGMGMGMGLGAPMMGAPPLGPGGGGMAGGMMGMPAGGMGGMGAMAGPMGGYGGPGPSPGMMGGVGNGVGGGMGGFVGGPAPGMMGAAGGMQPMMGGMGGGMGMPGMAGGMPGMGGMGMAPPAGLMMGGVGVGAGGGGGQQQSPFYRPPPSETLYLGDLRNNYSREEIVAAFQGVPGYVATRVRNDKFNHSVAFVEFASVQQAADARDALHNVLKIRPQDPPVTIHFARPSVPLPELPPPGSGGLKRGRDAPGPQQMMPPPQQHMGGAAVDVRNVRPRGGPAGPTAMLMGGGGGMAPDAASAYGQPQQRGPMEPAPPGPSLFVEGVPPDASEREIAHVFRPFIGYLGMRLVARRIQLAPLVFVDFASTEAAVAAREGLQGYKFDPADPTDRGIHIQFARLKEGGVPVHPSAGPPQTFAAVSGMMPQYQLQAPPPQQQQQQPPQALWMPQALGDGAPVAGAPDGSGGAVGFAAAAADAPAQPLQLYDGAGAVGEQAAAAAAAAAAPLYAPPDGSVPSPSAEGGSAPPAADAAADADAAAGAGGAAATAAVPPAAV
jgi:hypothetical protein